MSAWGDVLGRDTLGAFCRHTHARLEGSPEGPLAGTAAERWVRVNPEAYQALARRHQAGLRLVE